MLNGTIVILVAFAYLGLLFAVAYYADKRADQGRSVIASPYVYSLSLAVYATAWTFYGSVGRAAGDGVDESGHERRDDAHSQNGQSEVSRHCATPRRWHQRDPACAP